MDNTIIIDFLRNKLTWNNCKQLLLISGALNTDEQYNAKICTINDFNNNAETYIRNMLQYMQNSTEYKDFFNLLQKNNLMNKHNRILLSLRKNIIFPAIHKIILRCHKEKPLFDIQKRIDPYHFYLQKDKIGDKQYSSKPPSSFPDNRTSPVILINNEIYLSHNINDHHLELINKYKKEHNLPADIRL